MMVSVEDAASEIGIDEGVLRDNAVLGGAPKGYGPFRRVEGSCFRIMIDMEDAVLWDAAGRPIASSAYRDPPRDPKRTQRSLIARLFSRPEARP